MDLIRVKLDRAEGGLRTISKIVRDSPSKDSGFFLFFRDKVYSSALPVNGVLMQ